MTGSVIRQSFAPYQRKAFNRQASASTKRMTTPVPGHTYRRSHAHHTRSATLASVVVANPTSFENLVMFPLVASGAGAMSSNAEMPAANYVTLDMGLASGQFEITEVTEQGSIPELRVVNKGALPVLIVDGEELVGAKQNRVVNLTILVPSHSELTIPVSCVEAGRWRAKSRRFSSVPRAQYSSGRAKRMASVTHSMATTGLHHSDQSEVWSDIADMCSRLEARSSTGAMEALFVEYAPFLDDCVSACQPVGGQVGALFAVDDSIIGFDLFDREQTLTALLPKLVRSVAVDALDHRGVGALSRVADAKGANTFTTGLFLDAVGTASSQVTPAVGLGEDVRLTGEGVIGGALVHEGRVVHLSAFSQ